MAVLESLKTGRVEDGGIDYSPTLWIRLLQTERCVLAVNGRLVEIFGSIAGSVCYFRHREPFFENGLAQW